MIKVMKQWVVPLVQATCCIGLIGSLIFIQTHFQKKDGPICFRCNIVVIMIDNLRADHLPCYGYTQNTAPNMCLFAQTNVQFSHSFANSSWTLPSIMSFFTSLYPTNHGVGTTLLNTLNPLIVPLPALLQQHGYATIFVSSNQPNLGLQQGLAPGFDTIRLTTNNLKTAMPVWLDAIQAIRKSNEKRHPAFVFFHTDNLHDYAGHLIQTAKSLPPDPSYQSVNIPPLKFTEQTRSIAQHYLLEHSELGGEFASKQQYRIWHDSFKTAPSLVRAEEIFIQLPLQDREYVMSKMIAPLLADGPREQFRTLLGHVYDTHVADTDAYIGQLLHRLEQNNLLRNTIIIISSEHGEMLGENGLFGHATKMYNPQLHIPLILHIPRVKSAIFDDLIQQIDIYPTVLDLVGIKPQQHLGGTSLAWRINHESRGPSNSYVVSEWTNHWQSKTIQSKIWKLIMDVDANGKPTEQLFGLHTDSGELDDIAWRYPQIVSRLRSAYNDSINSQPQYDAMPKPFPDWIDPDHQKNLIETGYFNGQ